MFYYEIGSYESTEIVTHEKEYSRYYLKILVELCRDKFNEEWDKAIDSHKLNKFYEDYLYGGTESIVHLLCKDHGFKRLEITASVE